MRLIMVICHFENMTEIYRITSYAVYALLIPLKFRESLFVQIVENKTKAAFLIHEQS